MKTSKAVLVCVCLIELTGLVWSQNATLLNSPGRFGPRTGAFATRAPAMGAVAATLSGTSILFREQFNLTITNYDQSTSDVVACEAHITTSDTNGYFYDDAAVIATKSGSTYTCDVPVLTLWTLQDPTTDSISACVRVSFVEGITVGPKSKVEQVRRQKLPCLNLSVPTNDQTVTTTLSLSM